MSATNLTNIIITQPNGNRVPMQNRRTATGVVSAKQNWALNAEDTVDITVESPFPQTYNIGDRITIFGRDYKLNRLPSVKKTGMHQFQYDLKFEGVQYDLFRVIYGLTIDTTTNQLQDVQGDSLTGNLHRFMTVLVANANRVFPGKWKLGACPDTIGDKTLTFGESDNCLSVLQNLCSNFNVEFDIVQADGVYTINLYERVGQILPFKFVYGRGGGVYDLNRQNVSSANIVTRLNVYGSTENITSKYRADRLCLPGRTKGQSYIEKAEMVAKYGIFEGRKNFDDVKPTFTGSVETKVDEFSFIDTKFPFDLNAKNADGETLYLINGVSAKIHFNTGNLAGYDFEVKAYDHATHKFTLIKTTDDRGDVFPSETLLAFQFAEGNEYKVLDIAYSQDIEAAAEAELEEVANKYYDQNCQPKVQYGLSIAKSYLANLASKTDAILNFFAPGDYLHVVDKDIDVDKAIRIKSFVRNILDPYEYTLTISDTVTSAKITNRVISDLVELDKIVTINNLKDPTRARANWRSSREVLNMVFDPDGDYYTDKIKPNSIDTMALSVGAKSMQFGLMNTVFQPNFQGNNNVVKWQGGVLTHYTINEESAVSWVMADAQTTLTSNVPYYLYAKCEKNGTAGSYTSSDWEKASKYTDDSGLNDFINGDYADDKTDILTQIDGKIETWFQTTDPSSAWNTTALKKKHVGDMWYHTTNKELKYYTSSYAWTKVEDAKAIAAYDAASQARDTADGKRRVFVATPTTPYGIGDLWVNGSILRRCATAKTATQPYNVNDWVVAVDYDNTKTVIDGGLVTSGTLQVAGDNKSILAGITGQGTTASSVRFWAGASFENRATAPFRVLQDGSVVMTKADIEGIIKATSGLIGGFEIAPGRIGVAETIGSTNNDGLAIMNDFVKFSENTSNRTIWTGIGSNVFPATMGYPCLARFEYIDNMTYGQNAIGLYAKCRPKTSAFNTGYWYVQRAIHYDGNMFGIGGAAQFEDGYIGQAYTDTIECLFTVTHKYHFTACGVSYLGVDLPTKTQIDNELGNRVVMFDIEIVCDRTMPNKICVRSRTGAQIYGYNGQTISSYDMAKGDVLRLRYYNGGYHVLEYHS